MLLLGKFFLPLVCLFQLVSCQCETPLRRKEITTLSTTELETFLSALRQLHRKPNREGISVYDRYSKTHMDWSSEGHGSSQFLPWHRQFLINFERELQEINPSVILPYWDWSRNFRSPHRSKIFSSDIMGGNGDLDDNFCVSDGVFENLVMRYPRPHCLRRNFDEGNRISPFVSPRVLERILDIEDFDEFSQRLEVAHGAVHNNIGGERGDLTPMWSPNDPIFFLHHSFIDMLWYTWQKRHPDSDQYNGSRNGRRFRESDRMEPFDVRVGSTLDTQGSRRYCYIYPEYPQYRFEREEEKKVEKVMEKEKKVEEKEKKVVESKKEQVQKQVTKSKVQQKNPNSGDRNLLSSLFGSRNNKHNEQEPTPIQANQAKNPGKSRVQATQNLPPNPNAKPLPDGFIQMHHMDSEKVRQIEQEFQEINQGTR